MKDVIVKISALLLAIPAIAFAGWQVATPQSTIPNQPFFQAGTQQNTTFTRTATPVPSAYSSGSYPNKFAGLGQPAAVYAITVSGSLKENIQRIMDRYHWKVIWKVAYDYNFDGRVTGSSLPNVIDRLLQPFPLQAVMYMSNRTMTVVPRNS